MACIHSKFPGWKKILILRSKKIPFILREAFYYFIDTEFGPKQFDDLLKKKLSKDKRFLQIAKDGLLIFPKQKEEIEPNKIKIDQLYRNGHTIVCNCISSDIPHLLEAKNKIEGIFGEEIKNAAFLTPANSKGFPTHFDAGDLFVVQTYGSKEWTLYEKTLEKPLKPQIVTQLTEIIFKETLNQGDVLYVPRGIIHEARNTAIIKNPSIHISFAFFPN